MNQQSRTIVILVGSVTLAISFIITVIAISVILINNPNAQVPMLLSTFVDTFLGVVISILSIALGQHLTIEGANNVTSTNSTKNTLESTGPIQ